MIGSRAALNLLRDWWSPSREIFASVPIPPDAVRERIESATVRWYNPVVRRRPEGPYFQGKVSESHASLELLVNSFTETDIPIWLEVYWSPAAGEGSLVRAKVRLKGQGFPYVYIGIAFLIAILIFLPDPSPLGYVLAIVGAICAATAVMAIFMPRGSPWFPKRELHLAAERLAEVLDIGYGDLREQNAVLLR